LFFTYLWRELRRRLRQAIFIAIGLALGIGLVITVTAASTGVKNAQTTVLHALYGVGTDVTVTKAQAAGQGGNSFGFGFRQDIGTNSRPKAGTKISDNTLTASGTLTALKSTTVTTVSGLSHVAAAAGGLTLTDRTISGTVPAVNASGGNSGGPGSSRAAVAAVAPPRASAGTSTSTPSPSPASTSPTASSARWHPGSSRRAGRSPHPTPRPTSRSWTPPTPPSRS
jgi:putative ABC transport system permease protein